MPLAIAEEVLPLLLAPSTGLGARMEAVEADMRCVCVCVCVIMRVVMRACEYVCVWLCMCESAYVSVSEWV
jgi:hypothetical protein